MVYMSKHTVASQGSESIPSARGEQSAPSDERSSPPWMFRSGASPKYQRIERQARDKLDLLRAVSRLQDLEMFPGLHLKPLSGITMWMAIVWDFVWNRWLISISRLKTRRRWQYSIRINEEGSIFTGRYRFCFNWSEELSRAVDIGFTHDYAECNTAATISPMKHPSPQGNILESAMDDGEVDANEVAQQTGLEHACINNILKGVHSITPAVASGLESFFRVSADTWLNLQQLYDDAELTPAMPRSCAACDPSG